MFSRAEKTPLAEWWWSIDRELLGALILLMTCGMVLSFAASPPVAERLGLSPWHFVIRHAHVLHPGAGGADRAHRSSITARPASGRW